jgi:hypothetical protein
MRLYFFDKWDVYTHEHSEYYNPKRIFLRANILLKNRLLTIKILKIRMEERKSLLMI